MGLSTKSFYESGCGDSLIDSALLPDEINNFLKEEESILFSFADSFCLLIEIGCMHGRYLEWAVTKGKFYTGIDIVRRFIEQGRRRIIELGLSLGYQLIEGAAEDIVNLIPVRRLRNKKCLLFFPFNSFGNMEDAGPIISALKTSELPFFISSYQTTAMANECRRDYYDRCGYKNLKRRIDNKGVYFCSDDGLGTIAYHPSYIKRVCNEWGLPMRSMSFSTIGMAYLSATLEVKKTKLKPE